MPDALSLSRSDLPEEIVGAIDALTRAHEEAAADAGGWAAPRTQEIDAAYEALTAAILSRLANGAPASPSGSQASPETPSDPRPSGVDPSRMQWQPIATAPKNETWVLLSGGRIEYGWDREAKPMAVVGQAVNGGESGWQFAWYDSGYYGEYEDPTHWMPLPAPPAQETEAEGQDAKGGLVHEGSVAEGHAPDLTEAGRLAIKDA